jgi:antitoxin MazE
MQVSQWGNSLAVRLPKSLVEQLGLRAGDDVKIIAANETMLALEKTDQRIEALAQLGSFGFSLPADYKFDRDEANAR